MLGEEGQAMPAEIRIDPALGKARDAAGAHSLLEQGQRHAKPLGDDGCIDLDLAIFELDRLHERDLRSAGCSRAALTRSPGCGCAVRDKRIPQASLWQPPA